MTFTIQLVSIAAPQGSMMVFAFFSICINDIVKVSLKFAIILYANVVKQGTGKWASSEKIAKKAAHEKYKFLYINGQYNKHHVSLQVMLQKEYNYH